VTNISRSIVNNLKDLCFSLTQKCPSLLTDRRIIGELRCNAIPIQTDNDCNSCVGQILRAENSPRIGFLCRGKPSRSIAERSPFSKALSSAEMRSVSRAHSTMAREGSYKSRRDRNAPVSSSNAHAVGNLRIQGAAVRTRSNKPRRVIGSSGLILLPGRSRRSLSTSRKDANSIVAS
jgi:hypothetical protein